ncbi:SDR family NAD(P)-dependent oxidoreductase [Haliea sp. E17]|uniref:SDR family NAD(P)-dependent oxidoreductase n=1 Tax=Haliea sp. E17 TaxID=3401576 RepID=UPI003AAFCBA0
MQLEGKRIIVTGVASGIGAGTLRAYVREGATVTGLDIADQAGEKIVAEANAERPGRAHYRHCDISAPEQVFSAFDAAARAMGGIDVLSWTRTIAYEWASKYNIRCNCVNPTIKTPMYQQYLDSLDAEALAQHLASEKRQVPLGGSMGDVDRDMAPVMVFLASDASRFINGQIICVNGGRNMLRG